MGGKFEKAIARRIEIANAWKRANADGRGESFLLALDLDAVAPLPETDTPLGGVTHAVERARRDDAYAADRHRKILQGRRNKRGYIGIDVGNSRNRPFRVIHRGRLIGQFATPEEAARAYDTHATSHEGSRAVLNGDTATFVVLWKKYRQKFHDSSGSPACPTSPR